MRRPQQYAYAQARLQAAVARLPPPAFWQEMAGLAPAGLLQKMQASGVANWLDDLAPGDPASALEVGLRHHLRQAIRQVADWAPPAWQPALRYLDLLPYLPAVDAYWRGQLAQSKLPADVQAVLGQQGHEGRRLAQLHDRWQQAPEHSLRTVWCEQWQRLWTELPGSDGLESLVKQIEQHLMQFPQLLPEEAWAARDRVWVSMTHILHRRAFEPAALFAYLLVVALTMERLRAAWLERRLFPAPKDPA